MGHILNNFNLQNTEEFKKQPLCSINKDVDVAAREIQTVSKDQIQCLRELAKCHELINWIRTEIKGEMAEENVCTVTVFILAVAHAPPLKAHAHDCILKSGVYILQKV